MISSDHSAVTSPPQSARSRRGWLGSSFRRKEALAGYVAILPWLLGFVIFSVGPIVASFVLMFMKFITGEEGQTMWTELIGARSITPVKAVAETDDWLHYGGSTGEIILDSLSFSQAPPVNFGNANEAETIWNQELGLVIAGEATVEEAVVSICEQLAPVLAESD